MQRIYYEYHVYTPFIHMQISSNGLISFGSRFTSFVPQSFPISSNVIAPYWDDIDLRNKGVVRYTVVTRSHPTLSCLLDLTNDLIEELENVEFNATWVLVARWIDVCPFGDSSCFEVSIVICILIFLDIEIKFVPLRDHVILNNVLMINNINCVYMDKFHCFCTFNYQI